MIPIVWNIIPKTIMLLRKIYFLIPTTIPFQHFSQFFEKPPVDAVRIEEMINYFTYDYPDADGDEPFSITTEIGQCPWNPENKLMLVGLQTKKLSTDFSDRCFGFNG